MFDEKFNTAKNLALNEAIENYKLTKRGSFKVLKLVRSNILELMNCNLNMPEQIKIINKALDVKISYTTYKAFCYAHIIDKQQVKKEIQTSQPIKKEKHPNIDIFADLK